MNWVIAKAKPRPIKPLSPEENQNIDSYVSKLKLHRTHHASRQVIAGARKQAFMQIKNAPKPSSEQVAHNRDSMANSTRQGGELRGNSTDRARSRHNLFKAYGGEVRGHIACPSCGLKLHHTSDPEQNPNGYPKLERDKIVTGHNGGTYTLPNLVPSCHACNSERSDKPHPIGKPDWQK